jgi:NAD(P)-dependent dehydrogenase (short-subunit alcohol dehydrogenase family)
MLNSPICESLLAADASSDRSSARARPALREEVAVGALEGKVAVVTGAGRGIGREEAMLLASEGARVVVNDLGADWNGMGQDDRPASQVVREIETAGGQAVANFSDVATDRGAEELITQAIDQYGDLHMLVNNAGILRDGMVFSLEPELWESVIKIHLMGHYLPTRHAAAFWRSAAKNNGAPKVHRALVNTTSESGLFGNAGQSNYATAKLGIVGFTVTVAKELAKYGVTSNAIAPRARTRLTTTTFEGSGRADEFAEATNGFDPMDPSNIAPLVGFLATDAAASITGQVFIVYGGAIGRVRLPHLDGVIFKEGGWTIDALGAESAGLFEELAPGHFEGPRGYARLPKQ